MPAINHLSPAQIRYLREVLGVEQILAACAAESIEANQNQNENQTGVLSNTSPLNVPKRATVFVEIMNNEERELLTKMLTAMKLQPKDYEVFEAPTNQTYHQALSQTPIVSIIFGRELASLLKVNYQSGKFANQEGIATVVTYGPRDLVKDAGLKMEAWRDMKLAMTRLEPKRLE